MGHTAFHEDDKDLIRQQFVINWIYSASSSKARPGTHACMLDQIVGARRSVIKSGLLGSEIW